MKIFKVRKILIDENEEEEVLEKIKKKVFLMGRILYLTNELLSYMSIEELEQELQKLESVKENEDEWN